MSAKTWGWAEVAVGIAIDYFSGGALSWLGTPMIIGGLATEASVYLAPTLQQQQPNIQGTIMQTDAWAQLVYGTRRTGGVLAYINASGTSNETLDMVVAHAITDPTNGIDGLGDFWLNDNVLRVRTAAAWAASHAYAVGDSILVSVSGNEYAFECVTAGTSGAAAPNWSTGTDLGAVIYDNTVDWKNVGGGSCDFTWTTGSVGTGGKVRPPSGGHYVHGKVTQGIFAGMVELWAYFGTQAAFADIDSTLNSTYGTDPRVPWKDTAIGAGVVWTHWRFTPTPTTGGSEAFNNAFGGAIPYKLEATISGEKVYDPRSSTTAYSENPALIVRDFLTRDPMNGGCGFDPATIDDVNGTIPSANVCDQLVPMST